ncbi:MAG: hypothetical protein Q7I99_02185 [Acholeplasmataceae bacterium]|nr:hypothetical protein [Acholeplasmataceae bacterium]
MTRNLKITTILFALITLLTACSLSDNKNAYDNYNKIINTTSEKTYETYVGGVEDNSALLRFERFEGIDTLFVFSGEESVTITVYENIKDGRFKVVLIDPYDQVVELHETITLSCIEGQYKVKLVGDGATGTVSINVSSNVSVSFYPLSK